MSLKSVKNKIKSIDKTRQVTKAMEAVSAVKMRKSQEYALVARPYALHALKILQGVSGSVEGGSHPLSEARSVSKVCVVVVTSDRGLAGSLNSALFKEFGNKMKEKGWSKDQLEILSVGRRGYEYFSKRGFSVAEHYEQWGDFVDFKTVEPLIGHLESSFKEKRFDEAWILYTNFISTLRQEVYFRRVLPVTFAGVEEVVEGIAPERGKYAPLQEDTKHALEKVDVYTFEPSAEDVLLKLMPLLLKIQVYHSVLEANASEHSARMIAMKNASDNARDILKDLRLSYNKVRQAGITREVSEIVGGVESLK